MRRFYHAVTLSGLLLLGLWPAARAMARTLEAASPAPPSSDDVASRALAAVAGEGLLHSHAYEYLEELSDDIGGRVTSSPQAERAVEWGLAKMRAIGLDNVHAESWQMSHGWTRISADADMVAPVKHKLHVDAMGWVGSTPPNGDEGDVVLVNSTNYDQEIKQSATNWAGKILMVERPVDPIEQAMAGPGQGAGRGGRGQAAAPAGATYGDFLKAAFAAHAIAVIGGQGGSRSTGMNLTHTGILGFDTYYDIPVVSMTPEDQEQIDRFLARGMTVHIHINVQNRVTSGPVDSANVVGDIPGTEHPEQIVLIGGHLDSWDLAEGATDNGCGATVALGAAEAILRSGSRPKRTIRVVLFTGEEQGLLGSLAYVKAHQAEMANYVAAIILDSGQGIINGINVGGRDDLIPAVFAFEKSVTAFGPLGLRDNPSFGTDTGPFTLAGVPGIDMSQDFSDYRFTHHSQVDTFDKVQPEILIHNATMEALTAYWIADRDDRLATPWPDDRTACMLIDKNQENSLKSFGLWRFGEVNCTATRH